MPPPALRQKGQKPAKPPRGPRGPTPGAIWRIVSLVVVLTLGISTVALLREDAWNPFTPLDPNAAPTPITPLKLARTARDPALCRAALDAMAGAEQTWLADREDSPLCHIRTRTRISRTGDARLAPVETRCETALRLAMWTRHAVQPAATAHFGSQVTEIKHLSSYSCRRMRTSRGTSEAMSAHATARAIDVSGVRLDTGRRVQLLSGWGGAADEQAFWREVRDGACTYFRTVLSPDYNALHADHFHFAQGRWPACR
ncbi:MAG: extensin family protein [Pseudomonadota bacterium]